MAQPTKIKFGKGELVLEKSSRFVGLKKAANTHTKTEDLADALEQVQHPSLGGFELVKVLDDTADVNNVLDTVRALDEIDSGTHVYHAPGSDKPLIPTGAIYITFKRNVPIKVQDALIKQFKLRLHERRNDEKVVVYVTKEALNPIKCAIALQEKDEIKWAEPDLDAELTSYVNPTSKFINHMWHLKNTGRIPDSSIGLKPGADAKVLDAFKLLDGFGNPNIVIAVIDNGFDLQHPDLKTKIVKPWDLWNNSPNISRNDPFYTHGTPCASVAIAPANGGMCGAAPVARFMPVSGTGFSISSTEAMFDYVIRNGADIVSCSWGTVDSNYQLNADKIAAISKAAREGRGGKGCVICFAAGNEGMDYVNYYATLPEVICVAASTSEDEHPDYSNCGPEITVCAPSNGGNMPILAARASWDPTTDPYYGDGVDRGPLYQHFGGTSSATPLVAGICALMLSANPNLTAREVKDILKLTADKIGSPSEYVNGRSLRYGYGRVNAYKAVQEALRRAGKSVPAAPTPTPNTTPANNSGSTTAAAPKGQGLFRYGSNAVIEKRGFSVQIGSYNQWANVVSIAPGLESTYKLPALVHVVGTAPATYRVLLGWYNTLAEANRLVATLKTKGINGFAKDLKSLA